MLQNLGVVCDLHSNLGKYVHCVVDKQFDVMCGGRQDKTQILNHRLTKIVCIIHLCVRLLAGLVQSNE